MMGILRSKSKSSKSLSTGKMSSNGRKTSTGGQMTSEQFAAYLADLRDFRNSKKAEEGRPQRPPHSASTPALYSSQTAVHKPVAGPSTSTGNILARPEPLRTHARAQSSLETSRPPPTGSYLGLSGSVRSRYSVFSGGGRDYYPEKASAAPLLKPSQVVPTRTYMERGSRWMEKEEAFSLRAAMEDMQLRDAAPSKARKAEEDDADGRLRQAAQDEASELVWQHQHGIKPPEPGAPYRYKAHLRKDSYAHARAASVGRYGSDIEPTGLARDGLYSTCGSSSGSDGRASVDGQAQAPIAYGSRSGKAAHSAAGSHHRRRSSTNRQVSGDAQKPFSADQIWEESEGGTPVKSRPVKIDEPLRLKLRNAPNEFQPAAREAPDETPTLNPDPGPPLSRSEIHRNPPSQTRDPQYTTNTSGAKPLGPRPREEVSKKHGVEVRSEEIRQATSFKLTSRSKKLPTPSAVSDRPGRPIVSFDVNWKAPQEVAADAKPDPQQQGAQSKPQPASSPSSLPTLPVTPHVHAVASLTQEPSASVPARMPAIQVDAPADCCPVPLAPVIAVTTDGGPTLPTIVLPGEESRAQVPTNSAPDGGITGTWSSKPSARPLPTPTRASPFSHHSKGARPRSHWSPAPGSSQRSTAMCHECSFPIEGRFVALNGSSERFHPECFTCYTCGTSLEALEISPEPDAFRAERLERIRRREAGEVLAEEAGKTVADDGDSRLRFYCHLDWHELFAPRCRHCKTPILGEHIVALGDHFHYGHFFCAECGDPFEHGMTHIEKDGYAWCIACQTRRTERKAPKCKRCRKAVIGQYVQALGGEWHDECFRCATCAGGFDDGQIFPVGDRVHCTACRMRELKA